MGWRLVTRNLTRLKHRSFLLPHPSRKKDLTLLQASREPSLQLQTHVRNVSGVTSLSSLDLEGSKGVLAGPVILQAWLESGTKKPRTREGTWMAAASSPMFPRDGLRERSWRSLRILLLHLHPSQEAGRVSRAQGERNTGESGSPGTQPPRGNMEGH